MGRAPCCEKVGLKRGPWTPEEDEKLVSFITEHGHGSWRALPKKAGLLRCGKSCRLRWTNYLRPDIKRGEFSASEETAILQLHALLGNRWSAIASHLPKRTDNEIKNYWNTHLKKKLVKMGLDPSTHKPLADMNSVLINNSCDIDDIKGEKPIISSSSNCGCDAKESSNKSSCREGEYGAGSLILLRGASLAHKGSATTMHLTQWESVRLEAEARLTQEAKMRAKGAWVPHNCPSSAAAGRHIHEYAGNGHSCCIGALKGVSAVELMHALHNWEKSLQGQAGMLWPESWRVASSTTTTTTTTNMSSCCAGHSESSSSSSPPSNADASAAAARVPPSSRSAQTSCTHSPPTATTKLSWSDALIMPPKYPISSSSHNPPNDDSCTSHGCSRAAAGSFSSLMLDAVLGRSVVQGGLLHASYVLPKVEEEAGHSHEQEGISCKDIKMMNSSTGDHVDKHHNNIDEASINVSAVTGEMQDEACIDDDDDERSLSADGTSDLFRDLPRLKRDTTTTPVSYTALLSEEISDYWSNIVLKEQVTSPTIHITF